MIAIVDYGCGNMQSLCNAFAAIGTKNVIVTQSVAEIEAADRIVLPGVGNFGTAMQNIKSFDLEKVIRKAALQKPFLGICLGMQILFEESEEAPGVKGMGLVGGKAKRFVAARKIPQIGWNKVKICKENSLFNGIMNEQWFFFANSYFAEPLDNRIVAGEAGYCERFCAAIEKGNIWAVQFHPEKSGYLGLKILQNFAFGGERDACKKSDSLS